MAYLEGVFCIDSEVRLGFQYTRSSFRIYDDGRSGPVLLMKFNVQTQALIQFFF